MSKFNPARDLTLWYDSTHWFPFFQDESGDFFGPGHQEPLAFSIAVNSYIVLCGEEVGSMHDFDVKHKWATVDEDTERFFLCSSDVSGAIPITMIEA